MGFEKMWLHQGITDGQESGVIRFLGAAIEKIQK